MQEGYTSISRKRLHRSHLSPLGLKSTGLKKIQAPAIVEALVCCMCFLHTITLSEGPQICENPPISVPCQKLLRPHSRGSMLHVLFAHNHTFQRPTQNRNCNFITLCSVTEKDTWQLAAKQWNTPWGCEIHLKPSLFCF